MRRIRRNVGEERFVLIFDFANPADARLEEQVRAIAFRLDEIAIVTDDGIKILVARCIRTAAVVRLADASSTVNKRFIEAAMMWLVCGLVTQMPLSKNPGCVARQLQGLR